MLVLCGVSLRNQVGHWQGGWVFPLDQACPSPSWVWASLSGLLSAWGRTRSLPLEKKRELASRQEWLLHLFASCSLEHLSLQLCKNVNVLWPCVSWKRPSIPVLGSVSWIGGLMMLMKVKSLAHEDSLPFPLFLPVTFFAGDSWLLAALGFSSLSLMYWSFPLHLVFFLHPFLSTWQVLAVLCTSALGLSRVIFIW